MGTGQPLAWGELMGLASGGGSNMPHGAVLHIYERMLTDKTSLPHPPLLQRVRPAGEGSCGQRR